MSCRSYARHDLLEETFDCRHQMLRIRAGLQTGNKGAVRTERGRSAWIRRPRPRRPHLSLRPLLTFRQEPSQLGQVFLVEFKTLQER